MAIISFEEIETQIVEQESPVETAMDQELLEESIDNIDSQLDALDQLDETIAKQDELITDVEEGKKDPSEVKEELHEAMIAAEHFCQILGKTSIKKIADIKKADLSFESINNHPVEALKDFNQVLKAVRSSISQEAVEEMKKGWLEKFGNFFRGIDGDYKRSKSISSGIIKLVEANKDILEVREGMELSDANSGLLGNTVIETGRNFAEFTDKYAEALRNSTKPVQMKLKHLNEFNALKSSDSFLSPIGIGFGKSNGIRSLKFACCTKDLQDLFSKGVKDGKEVKNSNLFFQEVVVESKQRVKFSSVEEAINALKFLDKTIEEHFKIVSRPIRKEFDDRNPGTLGKIGLAIGGLMTAGGVLGLNLIHAGVGALIMAVSKSGVNKISRDLFFIAKTHRIWNDLVVVQREIVNMLKVRSDASSDREDDFNSKIGLVMNGKKV